MPILHCATHQRANRLVSHFHWNAPKLKQASSSVIFTPFAPARDRYRRILILVDRARSKCALMAPWRFRELSAQQCNNSVYLVETSQLFMGGGRVVAHLVKKLANRVLERSSSQQDTTLLKLHMYRSRPATIARELQKNCSV